MPQITSPLSTPAGMPALNSAHLGKAAGLRIHFALFSDFTAAITTGTSSYAADLWADGQEMTIASEADSGAVRVWRTALGHARTVKVGRLEVVLPANSNVVLAAAGVPVSGTGANGDLSVDKAAGIAYLKTAGAWASAGNISSLSSATAAAVEAAKDAGSNFMSGTLGPVADLTALNSTYPASSNAGREALVGASAPYSIYDSNGAAWSMRGGGSGSPPTITAVSIVSATTSATPNDATFAAFGAAACTEVLVANETGVTLQYQRGGTGNIYTILPGRVKKIVGITNASQISWRRADYANTLLTYNPAVQISGQARTSTETYTHLGSVVATTVNSGGAIALPALTCSSMEIANTTGKLLTWRIGASGSLYRLRPNDSVMIAGIGNASDVRIQASAGTQILSNVVGECYAESLTEPFDSATGIASAVTAVARFPLEEVQQQGDFPVPFANLASLRPRQHLRKNGLVTLMRLSTAANTIATRPADIADVATGDIAFGTSAVEYTQSSTSMMAFAAEPALATPINTANGSIHITLGFPKGTPEFGSTNWTTGGIEIRLYSAGSPTSPSANYTSYTISVASSFVIMDWFRHMTTTAEPCTLAIPISQFTVVGGSGADLSAITYARMLITAGSGCNGAKLRPMSIEWVPNAMTKGAVIWTMDDLHASQWEKALPILQKYGFPAVLGMDTTSKMGQPGALTPKQVFHLVNTYGWQVVYQTFRDATNITLSPERFADELARHQATMSALGVGNTLDASYGFGSITNITEINKRVARAVFRAAFDGVQSTASAESPWGEPVPFGDPMHVRRMSATNFTAGTRAARWQGYIDKAIADKTVAAFTVHDSFNGVDAEFLTALESTCEYTKAQVLAGNLEVHTLDSLIRKYYG